MSDRILEIIGILNACDLCSPSQCCYSCDNICGEEHDEIIKELYRLQEEKYPETKEN